LPSGQTVLIGSITLGIMALPTIVSISEDALRAVPDEYRSASLALGATRLDTIIYTVLPTAASGIIAAFMLGLGRVLGETMAVLMVTGNATMVPHSLLDPARTITATIAAEMGEAVQGGAHYQALFGLGIILFVITFGVNLVADLVLGRSTGKLSR